MQQPGNSHGGWSRLIRAAGYSWHGLVAAWRHEQAFRHEAYLTLLMAVWAFLLDVGPTDRALMLGSLILVLIVELLNSAIEATVDRISPDLHALSKRAKDIGSAAVMLALLNVLVVWAVILIPR